MNESPTPIDGEVLPQTRPQREARIPLWWWLAICEYPVYRFNALGVAILMAVHRDYKTDIFKGWGQPAIAQHLGIGLKRTSEGIWLLSTAGIVTVEKRGPKVPAYKLHFEQHDTTAAVGSDGATAAVGSSGDGATAAGNMVRQRLSDTTPSLTLIVDDEHKEVVATLTSRGVAKTIAVRAVRAHPQVAQALAEIRDWRAHFGPAVKNVVALVTTMLKDGTPPSAPLGQPASRAIATFRAPVMTAEERADSEAARRLVYERGYLRLAQSAPAGGSEDQT